MATMALSRSSLPDSLISYFTTPRIAIIPRPDGDVTLSPIIDPADYDNDTDYLNAIPGMREKLLEGINTPLEECEDIPEEWRNV